MNELQTFLAAASMLFWAGQVATGQSGLAEAQPNSPKTTVNDDGQTNDTTPSTAVLSDRFKRSKAPGTGRTVVQLTSGNAFCYALYYYNKKAYQKYDFHPQLTPDRRWILFTGGDPTTQTNHLFLLDVSDLEDTEGISPKLLSPTGEHDMIR